MAEEPPKKKVKFSYLPFPITARLVFFVGEVDFEDDVVSYDEVKARRQAKLLPNGQVPTLTLPDGRVYGQCNAILRWAGRKANLYPEELQLECDGIVEAILDIKLKMNVVYYKSAIGRHPDTSEPVLPLSDEQNAQAGPYFNDVLLPKRFGLMESLLSSSGGPYFCGKTMTICDLEFYTFVQPILRGDLAYGGIKPDCLNGCPELLALEKHIADHPRVRLFNENNATGGKLGV
jgi:glutathione S-transferase